MRPHLEVIEREPLELVRNPIGISVPLGTAVGLVMHRIVVERTVVLPGRMQVVPFLTRRLPARDPDLMVQVQVAGFVMLQPLSTPVVIVVFVEHVTVELVRSVVVFVPGNVIEMV